MSPKTVLVHLTDCASAPRLLAAALDIARAGRGHIVGLVVLPPAILVPAGTPGQADPIIIDAPRRSAQDLVTALEPILAATISSSGCTGSIEIADASDQTPARVMLDRAMTADIAVVGRTSAGWSRLEADAIAPDSIALGCGRPVLVMPDQPSPGGLGRRALIAWDGSSEAARAVFDALPILKSAAAVRIVWVAPENDPYLAVGLQPADAVAMLARHGVHCDACSVQRPRGLTGRTILEAASEFRADLLVMGCYGHSRLLEFVLGGASRYVLENATIPLLLSH